MKRPWLSEEENAYFDYCDEWKKTQKEFIVEHENFRELPDGTVLIIGRVGNHSIKVGDSMGYAKVLKIQAYGKELSETGEGLGCGITFDRMPYYHIMESYPNYEEWKERCSKTSQPQ